jgi:hypothetical protein
MAQNRGAESAYQGKNRGDSQALIRAFEQEALPVEHRYMGENTATTSRDELGVPAIRATGFLHPLCK